MLDAIAPPVSTARDELFTYASRSATRCSSDGEAAGGGAWACSGQKNAMTPISKRIRIITRSGYSAQIFRGKKNAAASGIDRKLGGQPHLFSEDRKSTRLNSSHSQISYAVF